MKDSAWALPSLPTTTVVFVTSFSLPKCDVPILCERRLWVDDLREMTCNHFFYWFVWKIGLKRIKDTQLLNSVWWLYKPSLLLSVATCPQSRFPENIVPRLFEAQVGRVENRFDRFLHDRVHVWLVRGRSTRSKATQVDSTKEGKAIVKLWTQKSDPVTSPPLAHCDQVLCNTTTFINYRIRSRVSLLMVFPPSARRRSLTPCSCFWRLSLSASAFIRAFCSCSTNFRACLIWKWRVSALSYVKIQLWN